MISRKQIFELANGNFAVQNFLMTLDSNVSKEHTIINLKMDAELYGWSSDTIMRILVGIERYYDHMEYD